MRVEQQSGRRFWTDSERATLRRLYGHTSTAVIAAKLGRSERSVYHQAGVMGLMTPAHRMSDATAKRLIELCEQGYCNRCIGRQIGFCRQEVRRWRKRLDAKPLNAKAMSRTCKTCIESVRAKTQRQCEAAGVESLGNVRALAFRRYARECGWPEDLRPRAVQILNFLRDNGPSTREAIAAGIGMPWIGSRRSLKSSDPEGSYLANLMGRGLVISLGRLVRGRGKGKSVHVYSLALNVEELIDGQAAETDGPA